jgi:hypothetical protein
VKIGGRWRKANDFYDTAYLTPDKWVFATPAAQAWFKCTATHLLSRIEFYLDLLYRHDVPCRVVYSTDPGTVIYEDGVQVVVIPPQ